jgi:cytidylate kinase
MMILSSIIAIDGPAASGKSTVGEILAARFGYLFFDTGVMYRAVTWIARTRLNGVSDEAAVTALAESVQIDVCPPSRADGRKYDVMVEGKDVTWEIRSPEVEADVSQVSAYPGVRQAMSAQQRRIGLRGKVVMVGRDIGTVVLPEAGLKIYLDASVEVRARRRYEETLLRGQPADYKEILAAMRKRDRTDSSRKVAPLKPALDAVILNTDQISAEEVVQIVIEKLDTRSGKIFIK